MSAQAQRTDPAAKPAPSGRLLLRMPRTLHAELARRAEADGTSLNQFITNALASSIGWGAAPRGDATERAETEPAAGAAPGRSLTLVLLANAIAIGLAAVAAIGLLLLAWLG